MKTQEFLDRYDSVSEAFTERELYELWINDLFDFNDENVKEVEGEVWGEPDRWNTCVTRVIQTECQEEYYDIQPDEVYPVEKTIIVWEGIPKNV